MGEHLKAQLDVLRQCEAVVARKAVHWLRSEGDPFSSSEEALEVLRCSVRELLEEDGKLYHANLRDLEQICIDWIKGDAPPNTLAERIINESHLSDFANEIFRRRRAEEEKSKGGK